MREFFKKLRPAWADNELLTNQYIYLYECKDYNLDPWY